MKTAVIVFPGSNCDRDMAVALEAVTGRAPAMVWHRETDLPQGTDFVALPGGFSYGDYLRSGAMAADTEIMGLNQQIVQRRGESQQAWLAAAQAHEQAREDAEEELRAHEADEKHNHGYVIKRYDRPTT